MKEIRFITSNPGKLKEARACLKPVGFEVTQESLDYPEIQADSLEEVVHFGLDWVEKETDLKGPYFLEDSGLFIAGLDEFPGVYSSFIFRSIGLEGILRLLDGSKARRAHFESRIGYRTYSGDVQIFQGSCAGEIANETRGEMGFGFDPIFIPSEQTETFAEMETDKKNAYSHRGRSLLKLRDFLTK